MSDFYVPAKELTSISSEVPQKVEFDAPWNTQVIQTKLGGLTVNVQPSQKVSYLNIVTYHEVGLNAQSCFEGFLNHPDASILKEKCTFYHITAPGQGPKEIDYKPEVAYPTMDELADQVGEVIEHFKLKRWVGMGAGAGANILLRYANNDQQRCLGLTMMAPLLATSTWLEWGFKKVADTQTSFTSGMPAFILDQLVNTYFSVKTVNECTDLVQVTKDYMSKEINAWNFGYFLAAYVDRTDLTQVIRPESFRVPTLILSGGNTIHTDTVCEGFPSFNASKMSHLEIFHVGDMCHLEQPFEVIRSFKLFIAGMGIIL